ncbi:PREDICTED: putative F-box/LRR-repeat protein 19 [Camelina sativa]|uniref:F-box/LRR-repeat protein 19 n=1 Tax=Camelina sativa TaxID=90675 RepID=A0ABM1RMC7_CAMSA|nr:PREDICTED: putative F-box/LRR-repeat protein 19 [Camelina sativa]
MEVNNGEANAKMEAELVPDWTELTWECLIDIFSRLGMEQRWNAPMLVCKTWRDVCNDPLLNLVFDLETWFLTSTETCNRWSFEFSKNIDSMLMSVVERSKGCLKEIRVRHCTDESLSYVADSLKNRVKKKKILDQIVYGWVKFLMFVWFKKLVLYWICVGFIRFG